MADTISPEYYIVMLNGFHDVSNRLIGSLFVLRLGTCESSEVRL